MADPAAEEKNLDDVVEAAISKSLEGKYLKMEPVGRGSYGQVWKVRRLSDNCDFVAKIMAQEKKHRYEAEAHCLTGCDHFGIVKLVDDFGSDFGPVICLEFADGGDLSKKIKSHAKAVPPQPLSDDFIGLTMVQLTMALQHIHSRRMLHRDIKAANVLLTSRGIVKLSDFGFSRQFDGTVSQAVADTFLGTPYYLAPELWKRQKYGKKADVWSLGIILYEMLMLKRPFYASNMRGLMSSVLQCQYEEPPATTKPEFLELLRMMLRVDPRERPSTADILKTPVMQQYWQMFLDNVARSPAIPDAEKQLIFTQSEAVKQSLSQVSAEQPSEAEEKNPDVILEGPIQIGSAKDWKPRYLVLNPQALVVTRVREDRRSQQLPLDTVASVSANAEEGFVICLTTGFSVWVRANSSEERDQWVRAITNSLKPSA